jgi:hypothetical protein
MAVKSAASVSAAEGRPQARQKGADQTRARQTPAIQTLGALLADPRQLIALITTVAALPSLYILSTIFLPLNGWLDRFDYSVARDFSNFWMGGRLALTGHVSDIYDLKAYMMAMHGHFSSAQPFMNFSYPPHTLVLLAPLGALPFGVALPLWLTLSVIGLLSLAPLTGTKWTTEARLILIAAPAVLFMLAIGQATALLAVLFIVGLRWIDQKPILAGVLLGVLSIKPHLCALLPFVLIARRAWTTIAAGVVTVATLVAISLIAFGLEPWTAYIAKTLPYQARVIAEPFGFVWSIMVSPYAWFVKLGASAQVAMTLHGLIALPIAVYAMRAYFFTLNHDPALGVFVLALATICVIPYGLSYDLVLPIAALALWLASGPTATLLSRAAAVTLALFLAMPVMAQVLYMADLFVYWPLIGAALLVTLIHAGTVGHDAPVATEA